MNIADRYDLAHQLRVDVRQRFALPRVYDKTALFSKRGVQPKSMAVLVAWGKDAKRTSIVSFEGKTLREIGTAFRTWTRRYGFRQSRRALW